MNNNGKIKCLFLLNPKEKGQACRLDRGGWGGWVGDYIQPKTGSGRVRLKYGSSHKFYKRKTTQSMVEVEVISTVKNSLQHCYPLLARRTCHFLFALLDLLDK